MDAPVYFYHCRPGSILLPAWLCVKWENAAMTMQLGHGNYLLLLGTRVKKSITRRHSYMV